MRLKVKKKVLLIKSYISRLRFYTRPAYTDFLVFLFLTILVEQKN